MLDPMRRNPFVTFSDKNYVRVNQLRENVDNLKMLWVIVKMLIIFL